MTAEQRGEKKRDRAKSELL